MMLNIFFVHLIAIDQSPVWVEPALEVGRDLNHIVPSESTTLPSIEENLERIVTAATHAISQIPTGDPFVPDPSNPPCWYAVSGERILPSNGIQSFQREGASWARLQITNWSLSRDASLQVRSRGSEWVEYTAKDLNFWSGYTHFLEGSNIEFRLIGDEQDYVDLNSVMWGNPDFTHPSLAPGLSSSLCGADNRTAFNDDRVGRITRWDGVAWCTAWMTSAGVTLSAGHCFDYQGGVCGSNTQPDGTNDLQAGSIVEWNVPASNANGATNPSAPEDQYPINFSNLTFNHVCGGFGTDWAVFHLNPNSVNSDNPHVSHNWHRISRETPPANDTIRITGFGSDNTPVGTTGGGNAQNSTSQTDTGPFVTEQNDGSGGFMHRYQVDTTGGNSGSPVLWTNTSPDVTIGIHVQAGCSPTDGSGSNRGTSFENNALENAINNYWSNVAVFVDAGFPDLGVTEDGTAFRPFSTVLDTASTSTRLIVAEGFYGETGLIDTPCFIEALVGPVTIGE